VRFYLEPSNGEGCPMVKKSEASEMEDDSCVHENGHVHDSVNTMDSMNAHLNRSGLV
jgi:hypothetical protein